MQTESNTPVRYSVKPKKRTPNRALMELRLNAGLSPNDLGVRAGCSGRAVRDAEAGTLPHPRIQFAIANALGTTVIDLWPIERQRQAARR